MTTALERIALTTHALKVFPLPSAVLFPHAALPLHIFEPRYRDLVRDALAGDKVMALAQLEPGWESQYGERPPLQPMLCAGLIIWHEELPDGRYNILLQGVARARLLGDRALELGDARALHEVAGRDRLVHRLQVVRLDGRSGEPDHAAEPAVAGAAAAASCAR